MSWGKLVGEEHVCAALPCHDCRPHAHNATADDVDSLGKLVVARIQAVEGITRTLTCPVVKL